MGRFGKVLGAIAGLVIGLGFGSLPVALVLGFAGAVIGHLLDAQHKEAITSAELPDEAPKTAAELEASVRAQGIRDASGLFIAVARLDGEVSPEQIRAARQFFETLEGQVDLDLVRDGLKAAIASPPAIEDAAASCQRLFTASERLGLLSALYEVAGARGLPSPSALHAVREAAGRLGLSAEDLRQVATVHAGELVPHFETLGLTADATDEEVKRAYRKLASEHHPDRAAHLGARASEQAAARFREIDAAYEAIRRARSL